MNCNFDEIIPRRNSHSVKWDLATNDHVLPMWVADMDFRTAPPIIRALAQRVQHGIFGYTHAPQAYYDAITSWFERRHHVVFQQEWTLYTTGVVPALSAIIKALTLPGDKVIVQTPVYHLFFSTICNNACETAVNRLIYQNGTYTIDYDDLEEKASDPQTKLFLLCSPHNPVGRVWSREELTRIGEICFENNVIVVSDEIHCDLVYQGYRHIPFASLGGDFLGRSVTCTAPSKTFNIAGLHVANIHAADESIRNKINKVLTINEASMINPFAVEALIAAYNEGEEWLDELIRYLYDNYLYLKKIFEEHLPQFPVLPLEATYLVWVDCSVLRQSSKIIADKLLEQENLWINPGIMYGASGENFIRLNIACPRQLLAEGLRKICRYVSRNGV
jgi:cystathionine beta-lyase